MIRILMQTVIVAALALTVSGCKSNCDAYCERTQECWQEGLNVDRCVDACSEYGQQSDSRADRVEGCAGCLDRQDTCSGVLNNCIDDCFGIPTN